MNKHHHHHWCANAWVGAPWACGDHHHHSKENFAPIFATPIFAEDIDAPTKQDVDNMDEGDITDILDNLKTTNLQDKEKKFPGSNKTESKKGCAK